jgi:hypothetical protein
MKRKIFALLAGIICAALSGTFSNRGGVTLARIVEAEFKGSVSLCTLTGAASYEDPSYMILLDLNGAKVGLQLDLGQYGSVGLVAGAQWSKDCH